MTALQQYLKLRNGTDVRGIALEGVENEPVTLTNSVKRIFEKLRFPRSCAYAKSDSGMCGRARRYSTEKQKNEK